MTDQALDILKLVLLGLLYLFFARVLWAVWSEVRRTSTRPVTPVAVDDHDATNLAGPTSRRDERRDRRAVRRGRGSHVGRLTVIEPKSQRGTSYPMRGEITIGRDPAATISVTDDTFVSQHHARIYDVDGQAMVEDLGSTNGSFHNGNRLVGARLLHPGDRVQFGYTVLEAR